MSGVVESDISKRKKPKFRSALSYAKEFRVY